MTWKPWSGTWERSPGKPPCTCVSSTLLLACSIMESFTQLKDMYHLSSEQ